MGKMSKLQLSVRNDLFTDEIHYNETTGTSCDIETDSKKSSFDYDFIFEDSLGNLGNSTEVIFVTSDHNSEYNHCREAENGMPTILIEVPHVIAEETVSYTDLSNVLLEPEPEVVNGDNVVEISTRLESKNVFLENVGQNTPQNFENKPNVQQCKPVRPYRKSSRAKMAKPPEKKQEKDNVDLMWLLDFKLDHINSVPFKPLDELPQAFDAKPDAKERLEEVSNPPKERRHEEGDEDKRVTKSKPPFTYTELIECALMEKGPLTVSEIYRWISDTFPYYKSWDDRWKNSVRHNLSINPYFRKGTKSRQGSGHLWTVSKSATSASKNTTLKRQRFHDFEEYTKKLKLETEDDEDEVREAALAAANIEDKENLGLHKDILLSAEESTMESSLEQTAEEILRGVKRNVAVEYIDVTKMSTDEKNDFFINPVSKEVLMGECGFLNQIELNLTAESADPLCISESEQVFGLTEDLVFQYVDASQGSHQLMSSAN